MRVLVTGATGFIGTAVVRELLDAGHEVVGLARSDASALALTSAGVEVRRGSLDDLDGLRAGAAKADGVVHLAYDHEFSDLAAAAVTDRSAVLALADGLTGSGKPLVIASGSAAVTPGRVLTETDAGDPVSAGPRTATEHALLTTADQGVRAVVVRLPRPCTARATTAWSRG